LDAQPAFQHLDLERKAEHDVEIVGDLVGVSADERALDLVDGAIESVERHIAELFGELVLQRRIVVFPEWTAARDHVLPEPRLALMHARRHAMAERRAIERLAHALLVHGMAGFMQPPEQRIADVIVAHAGGDAYVTGREPGAERRQGLGWAGDVGW